jgi:alkylated DNA repair dioxygenase AlkB
MTATAPPPEGFVYQPDFLPPEEERELITFIRRLPLKELNFHGYIAKRRVVSFGSAYDFESARLKPADPIPEFLTTLRDRAAGFAGLMPETLPHALVTEYTPGAAIDWHKDKRVFGEVIGVSLLSECTFRLRRKVNHNRWERYSRTLRPRSAYLLRGAARDEWEHSIPPVRELRYSVTFRNLLQVA